MLRLKDKIAVVTGGSVGIGFAIAKRFVQEGALVFITGRRQGELDKAVLELGASAQAVQGDLTIADDIDRLFETVRSKVGRLDILIANSGISEKSALTEITEDHFDSTFDLNVKGTLFTVQGAVPLMGAGSTVVLVSSIAGMIGTPGYTTYNASKAAIRSYARTWTNEFAKSGIRVNTLSPGPVNTEMMQRAGEEFIKMVESKIPLGRMAEPSEVADAALFLASDESRYIAGVELIIDGGWTQV